jgi:Uri superfamily endonuclease
MGWDGGTYALIMQLEEEADIQVGALGRFLFRPGYYLYVGSALNGVSARVSRHLRARKKLRWHIDYLLGYARAVEVWYALGAERSECLWAGVAGRLPEAVAPVPGFGSSDCFCPSHLFHFPRAPSFQLFRAGVGIDLRIRT